VGEFEVLNDFLKVYFLLREPEERLVEVEGEVALVAALFDPENGLVALGSGVEVGHEGVPVVEVFLLRSSQSRGQRVTSLFQIRAFLLRFPVLAQHFLDAVLVKLEFLGDLIDPDNLVDHLREVTHMVQGIIDFVFIKHLHLQLLNVLVD
jgi:hypothetical protein